VSADGCQPAARSLLCRTFDAGLAECCNAEGVGLLAYSPLAMGLLTVGLVPYPWASLWLSVVLPLSLAVVGPHNPTSP